MTTDQPGAGQDASGAAPADQAPAREASSAEAAPGPTTGDRVAPLEAAGSAYDHEVWRIVVVAGVRLELPGVHPEVLLHETVPPYRELRIPVGFAEGTAIAYGWRGVDTPRPLTHQVFAEVLERHRIELEAVRITARRGNLFFAELDTMGPRGRQIVPCRPSDAIALVVRRKVPTPLLVADWVFSGPEP